MSPRLAFALCAGRPRQVKRSSPHRLWRCWMTGPDALAWLVVGYVDVLVGVVAVGTQDRE
jgi:hypothetical protein